MIRLGAPSKPFRLTQLSWGYWVLLVTVFGRNNTQSFRSVPGEVDVTDETGSTLVRLQAYRPAARHAIP